MSRYLTEGLPFPVILSEETYPHLRELRIEDYVERARALGIAIDTEKVVSSPHVAAPEAAAAADLYFVRRLNHTARVTLLSQFAEDADLDLHLTEEGLERLPNETDAAARERLRLSRKGKSAAGPDDYYISKVRNESSDVVDVAVTAETRDASERIIALYVLTKSNGGLISDELRARLTEVTNDPTFRSRNVTVEIRPAIILTKNIVATIYLYPTAVLPDDDEEALRKAYAADQKLGFDLTRSYVEKQLHRSGVQRVELPGWVNAYADTNESIAIGSVSINRVRLTS